MREVISHDETGLFADFFDVDGLASQALRILKDPSAYRSLGTRGRALVEERYSLDKTLPKLWEFFTSLAESGGPSR